MRVLSFQAFTDCTGPLISNATHMKTMIGCMNVILSNSTLPVKVSNYLNDEPKMYEKKQFH